MRRLHQVILATVAVASILGFLLYKHEYDRLSNLLEVLNTFGVGSSNAHNCNPNADFQSGLPASHDLLLGVWQQVENVYVYSAYLERGKEALLIGIVPSSISFKDVGVSKCLFWYEPQQPDEQSRRADLNIKFLDEESPDSPQESWKIVSLSCAVPGGAESPKVKKPYAVSLVSTGQSETNEAILPQILLQELLLPPSNNVTLAVCTPLRSPHVDAVLLTQFVKFHHQVGASRFTFYNLGLSPQTQNRLKAIATELPDLTIRILPWNFPFEFTDAESPLAGNFLKWDCITRHAGASYVLFSHLANLVVPKYHSHLTNLLQDEDKVSGHLMGRVQFKERVFCTELENNPYTRTLGASVWPMFLKTGWVDVPDLTAKNEVFLVKSSAVKTIAVGGSPVLKNEFVVQTVSDEVAVINSYRNCSPYSVADANYDKSLSMVRRFLNLMK